MSFIDRVKQSFGVFILDEKSTVDIANDEGATGHGFLTLAILGLVTALLQFVFYLVLGPLGLAIGLASIVFTPILYIALFVIGFSIMHLIAKLFGGQANWAQYFRPTAGVSIVSLPSAIPIIGGVIAILLSIWYLVINVSVLMKVHKLSLVRAIIATLIPFFLVLLFVLFMAYFMVLDPSAFVPRT